MKNKNLFLLLIFAVPVFSFERTSIDQATFKVGKSFFDRQLYSEAEGRFLDIVRKYPDSPLYQQSLFYLGNTYAHMGEYKPALQYYKLLLTKSKTISEKQQAVLGIAKSWLQLGVHDKAGDFYSFYATEYPESEHTPAALYFAGIARERDDNVSSAIEKYRAILKDYESSKYYAKAIEKVAVLDNSTPESLWDSTQITATKTPEEPALSNDIWEFEDTGFKAQSSEGIQTMSVSPVASSPVVITQMIQTPPTIVTQFTAPTIVTQIVDPIVITQVVESPAQFLTQRQVITQQVSTPAQQSTQQAPENPLKNAEIVHQKDGEFVPVMTTEQIEHQKMLESYKKIWEEEYQLKLKKQELEKAHQNVKDLAQLSEDKAKVLQVKEQSLQEQKDRIQNNVYTDLNKIDIQADAPKYQSPPMFLQSPPQTEIPAIVPELVTTTEVAEVAQVVEPVVVPTEAPIEEVVEEDYYDEYVNYGDEDYYGDEYDNTVDVVDYYGDDYYDYEEYE